MGLLDAANVVTGDGNWTAGYEIESWGCAVGEYITDICAPDPIHVAGNTYRTPGSGEVGAVKIEPFAFTAGLTRETRYSGGEEAAKATEFLAASENLIAQVFSEGFSGFTGETLATAPDVGKPSVTPVPAGVGTTVYEDLLTAWSDKTTQPWSKALLHVGLGIWLGMTQDLRLALDTLGVQLVTSPGYPSDFVALTGPVAVRLSSIQTLTETDALANMVYIEATRLAAIEFDPCLAFVPE